MHRLRISVAAGEGNGFGNTSADGVSVLENLENHSESRIRRAGDSAVDQDVVPFPAAPAEKSACAISRIICGLGYFHQGFYFVKIEKKSGISKKNVEVLRSAGLDDIHSIRCRGRFWLVF